MATFGNMETPSVRATIKELKPARVAKAMGLPNSTVWRWMQNDRIPGQGTSKEWRIQQFQSAVAKLRAEQAVAA